MTKGFLKRISKEVGFTAVMAKGLAAAVFAFTALAAPDVKAQEIQLTGPLAGAPPVREQRLYRKNRFQIAPSVSFTLLDEYRRSILVGGRLQYNITDWFAIGVAGNFAAASIATDLTDQISSKASSNIREENGSTPAVGNPNIAPNHKFDEQTGRIVWIANPELTFVPFRGKLSLFDKLYVDTDAYFHVGAAFVGVEERRNCGGNGELKCTDPSSFGRNSRVAIAPSFGLGLNFYPTSFFSFGFEYRAFPFAWNRGGFDSRGGGPNGDFPSSFTNSGNGTQPQINQDDRTFKFNQMVSIFIGFSLGERKVRP